MSSITIIGAGNMGSAIAGLALAAGSQVQVLTREATEVDPRVTAGTVGDEITGDVVVLALPYGALDDVLGAYEGRLDGKVLVDITNPLDFATFDSL
ncbi:NAD(P)-binding domain-containing protein, partial [Cellulosimicrobium funkei]